ncbi:MAG: hypothetical protein HUJ68_03180 [Clostridia bacterium]|nr:hypothetical protein [Clostridia bacterium]
MCKAIVNKSIVELIEKSGKEYGVEFRYSTPLVNSTNSKKGSKGIKETELMMILEDLKTIFYNKSFSNKDIPQAILIKWNLSNRQTPSRLKKLAEVGKLKIIDNSPYVYKLI